MSQELEAGYEFTKAQIKEMDHLRTTLAEREAECLKLREYFQCIKEYNLHYGLPVGVINLYKEALSTPPSTSYLEQLSKISDIVELMDKKILGSTEGVENIKRLYEPTKNSIG